MVKIKKYANVIERFLHGEKGQRFFNFAYSVGAAIVIWGALFKILHLPGGSTLLCIGMGTEIAMFLLTAFDRPPKEYAWEDVFPVLDSKDPSDRPDFAGGGGVVIAGHPGAPAAPSAEGGSWSGAEGVPAPVVATGLPAGALTEEDAETLRESISRMAAASEQLSQMAELTSATRDYLEQLGAIADQMAQLRQTTEALNQVSAGLLDSYRSMTGNSEQIAATSTGYVERLSELDRNIGALNTIYELQVKSSGAQLESIERTNRGLKDIRDMYEKSARDSSRYCEETERMARYMKQLNSVYEKMLTAMTVNMGGQMMGAPSPFTRQEE